MSHRLGQGSPSGLRTWAAVGPSRGPGYSSSQMTSAQDGDLLSAGALQYKNTTLPAHGMGGEMDTQAFVDDRGAQAKKASLGGGLWTSVWKDIQTVVRMSDVGAPGGLNLSSVSVYRLCRHW